MEVNINGNNFVGTNQVSNKKKIAMQKFSNGSKVTFKSRWDGQVIGIVQSYDPNNGYTIIPVPGQVSITSAWSYVDEKKLKSVN